MFIIFNRFNRLSVDFLEDTLQKNEKMYCYNPSCAFLFFD